jgi:outer membrane protein TolC
LQAEQRAKSALADAEAAQIWPALGLVGRGSWTNTPGRVDAKSPYFADEANEASAFFGVGLRVPLGIWERREKAAQARADALATAARVRHLQSGLFADLVRAHTELVQWSTTHQVRDSGQKASQRILTQATSGFLLGTSDAKSLLDAMVNHSLARKSYLEAIFQLNLAWVKLEQAVGQKL